MSRWEEKEVRWVLLLAGSLLAGLAGTAGAADPPAEAPGVYFYLSEAQAAPGDRAVLTLSVKTDSPLKSLSVSLDFDETKLTAVGVRRLFAGVQDGEALPKDIASTSLSNVDDQDGNQPSEGWIHVEIDSTSFDTDLPLRASEEVPILEIEFQVQVHADPGFSPVTFATVGPADGAPAAPYGNSVEFADLGAPAPPAPVGPENFKHGGVAIVGEVGFMRGDTSRNKRLDITDPILSLAFLFQGGDALPCADAADADDNGVLEVTDAVLTLSVLYLGYGELPPPNGVDRDPTPDDPLHCYDY